MIKPFKTLLALLAVSLTLIVTVVDTAEARRAGGGFGSRGTRTFQAPPVTRTAPAPAAPIERTMTPRPANQPAANQPAANRPGNAAPASRGFFGGFGGSLIGGLMVGGLIGMLMGNGLGGGIGFLGLLLQVGLIVGAIALAMRFFGQNRKPAFAGAGGSDRQANTTSYRQSSAPAGTSSFSIPRIGGGQAAAPARPKQPDEIGIVQSDLETFGTMLASVQTAFAAEDYAGLRRLTTPEAMSFLAEELSDNATRGLKNEVRDVNLVQGDLAEAWREDDTDFATVAMRYESVDVMRDRASGSVVSGDPDRATETAELWTFVRKQGGEWQVSAIQAAA